MQKQTVAITTNYIELCRKLNRRSWCVDNGRPIMRLGFCRRTVEAYIKAGKPLLFAHTDWDVVVDFAHNTMTFEATNTDIISAVLKTLQ